jgi:hypothetical protein
LAKKTLDVEFNIAPVFDIHIYSQGTEGVALRFGDVSFKGGPVTCENEIYVETNMGKPYKIVQRVASPWLMRKATKSRWKISHESRSWRPAKNQVLLKVCSVKKVKTLFFVMGYGGHCHLSEYRLTMTPDPKREIINLR